MFSKEEFERTHKEEIEEHIKLVKLKEYEANSTEKALVEYLEQLETKEQKLIEKLEEDIAEYRKEMQNTNIKLNQIHYMKRIEYAQEILKIVKGEKQ